MRVANLCKVFTAAIVAMPLLVHGAWHGFDLQTGQSVEFDKVRDVQKGKAVEFFDHLPARFGWVMIEEVEVRAGEERVYVLDLVDGVSRVFVMEKRKGTGP